jgi:hypothetical protein
MLQDFDRNREVDRNALMQAMIGAALAAVLVCASAAAARAGEDDEDGASVMNNIMHTLGLQQGGDSHTYDGIDYDERSPLVVPPTRNLPPPVSSNKPPVANWPKDQDVQRAKEVKKDSDSRARYQKDYVTESSRVLSPSELNPTGASGSADTGRVTPSADAGYGDPRGTSADPRDHGQTKSLFSGFSTMFKKEEYATFTGEPRRETLTDPPPGYMTPSPDQPYGIGPKEAKPTVGKPGDHGDFSTQR